MKPRYCKHGSDVSKYICPECDHEKQVKRQRAADRERFKAQIKKIKGGAS